MLQTDTIKIKCTREEISSNERTTGAYRRKKKIKEKEKKKKDETHMRKQKLSVPGFRGEGRSSRWERKMINIGH